MDEAFGDNALTLTYFYYRSIIKHTLPFLMSVSSIFGSDIIFLESDWWLVVVLAISYTATNYSICEYAGNNKVYFMDWTIVSKITPYSPIVAGVGFTIITLAFHFFLCLFTQLSSNRYEFQFQGILDAQEKARLA